MGRRILYGPDRNSRPRPRPTIQKTAHGKKPSDPFLTGDPFTLDQMLMLLKQDAIPMRRRKEAIENRGIDFALSSDALSKIQSAGATDDILDVIKSKAKPAAAAPFVHRSRSPKEC